MLLSRLHATSAIVLIADHSEKNNRGKLYGISQMICGSGRFIVGTVKRVEK